MKNRHPHTPRLPHKCLIVGSLVLLLGVILILYKTGSLPGMGALWPVPFMLMGLVLLYAVFFKDGHETYVFTGIFLTLSSTFFLLLSTVLTHIGLSRIWPLFMTFAGIALLFYGLRRRGAARITMILPALTIICLSLIFLPFSLRLFSFSFREFVLTWWPALFVVLGLALILADFLIPRRRRHPDDSEKRSG